MDDLQQDVLENLSSAVNYRRWFLDLALPWLGDNVLEIGSGVGDHALDMAGRVAQVTASEDDAGRVTDLEVRFADVDNVTVRTLSLPTPMAGEYTGVVSFNVLEHIEDHGAAITNMRDAVQIGGHVVTMAPAVPFAFSEFDGLIGHHRRYRRKELVGIYEAAGLEVVKVHHVNIVGLLGWILLVKGLRGRPKEGFALRVFEAIVPILARLEALVRPPIGQSLFIAGRRTS